MAVARTPVWLVTGFLGAGKTTLLARWLTEPALAHAALVVNEVGEVGLDDRVLARSVDSAALVANACVCCTGLPGLEQALTDLWWDRLHRRRPAFDAVVIETTGLADPGPVLQALATDPFLQARYHLAGVVVVASATAGWPGLTAHPEALAQLRHADVVVASKADRADPAPLLAALQMARPGVPVVASAQASAAWDAVLARIAQMAQVAPRAADPWPPAAPVAPAQGHHHSAQARFVPGPTGLDRSALLGWAAGLCHPGLQRLKGVLQSADGQLYMAQWAPGDAALTLVGFEGPVPRLGLTCIEAAAHGHH
ncbi:MAG: hypothetical protein RJA09_288 [Pseudomonadota bacterium]